MPSTRNPGLLQGIQAFYKDLYSKWQCNDDQDFLKEFLQGIDHAKLNKSQAASAKEEFSAKGISKFISSQSSNKAPGITGVTSAYYKYLWKIMPRCLRTTNYQNVRG